MCAYNQEIENIKVQLINKFHPMDIILFGSRARGDNSPVSDYDIAVFGKTMTEK
ncbi:hypothetical protein SCACP_31900 [Sporomusa carbonis]|uniref:nucleotidyltransferase family protein n=1 Tax=Sporomusa carbonis TaxID=3076075 RepID=UPI003A656896